MRKKSHNKDTGRLGENLAASFLSSRGYRIIERNFRKKQGDIDIVALEGETLVFIEVKTRSSRAFGRPEDAITPWKRQLLLHSVHFYKHLHPELPDSLRIDLVAVDLDDENKCTDIRVYKNITG